MQDAELKYNPTQILISTVSFIYLSICRHRYAHSVYLDLEMMTESYLSLAKICLARR